jgi:Cysteine-rich secretory protein family
MLTIIVESCEPASDPFEDRYVRQPTLSATEVVGSWYGEIAQYDFNNPIASYTNNKVGHFTQVVWRSSSQLAVRWRRAALQRRMALVRLGDSWSAATCRRVISTDKIRACAIPTCRVYANRKGKSHGNAIFSGGRRCAWLCRMHHFLRPIGIRRHSSASQHIGNSCQSLSAWSLH